MVVVKKDKTTLIKTLSNVPHVVVSIDNYLKLITCDNIVLYKGMEFEHINYPTSYQIQTYDISEHNNFPDIVLNIGFWKITIEIRDRNISEKDLEELAELNLLYLLTMVKGL